MNTTPVVSDSTCLIAFERIGLLDLMSELFTLVTIPPAVDAEFGKKFSWLRIVDLKSVHLSKALNVTLGKGESEAIALAVELNCQVITDDKQARAMADSLGIRVVGAMGILIRAKNSGFVDKIAPIIDEMEANCFRIGKTLRDEVLRVAGEHEQ